MHTTSCANPEKFVCVKIAGQQVIFQHFMMICSEHIDLDKKVILWSQFIHGLCVFDPFLEQEHLGVFNFLFLVCLIIS